MPIPPDFHGAAKRMTTADMVSVAKLGGYEVAVLQAVMDVEAGGAGFDSEGRPKILVERHVFYAQLGPGPKRNDAIRQGLAYLTWGTLPYPATSAGNYALLARMMAVDQTAALKSVSYGLGQVMGFNCATCGYATVQDMVAAACESEMLQFGFLLRFVEKNGLAAALKRHDWAGFARGYNGSGAVNAYAAKLSAAYGKHLSAAGRPALVASIAVPSISDTLNDAEWLRVRAGQSV